MIYPDPKKKRIKAGRTNLAQMRVEVWNRQAGRCAECNRWMKLHGDIFEAGHLRHYKSKGSDGDDTLENCDKMLCYDCHFGPKHHGPRWTGLMGE